jgi:uncharacterized membrane protein
VSSKPYLLNISTSNSGQILVDSAQQIIHHNGSGALENLGIRSHRILASISTCGGGGGGGSTLLLFLLLLLFIVCIIIWKN